MAENWKDAGALEAIPDGEVRSVRIDNAVLCIGVANGELFAVDDECPHAGGSLSEGMLDGDQVICPLHAYGFEVGTGHCPDDPSCSIRSYPIRKKGDTIQVQLPES